jgi:hypothetical protein
VNSKVRERRSAWRSASSLDSTRSHVFPTARTGRLRVSGSACGSTASTTRAPHSSPHASSVSAPIRSTANSRPTTSSPAPISTLTTAKSSPLRERRRGRGSPISATSATSSPDEASCRP